MAVYAALGKQQRATVEMINKWMLFPKFMHIFHSPQDSLVSRWDIEKWRTPQENSLWSETSHPQLLFSESWSTSLFNSCLQVPAATNLSAYAPLCYHVCVAVPCQNGQRLLDRQNFAQAVRDRRKQESLSQRKCQICRRSIFHNATKRMLPWIGEYDSRAR